MVIEAVSVSTNIIKSDKKFKNGLCEVNEVFILTHDEVSKIMSKSCFISF